MSKQAIARFDITQKRANFQVYKIAKFFKINKKHNYSKAKSQWKPFWNVKCDGTEYWLIVPFRNKRSMRRNCCEGEEIKLKHNIYKFP